MKVLMMPLLAGLLAALTAVGAAADAKLPQATDLSALAAQSQKKTVPILLMFSAPDCGYCRALERDYLKPMVKSGDYEEKVIIRRVEMGIGSEVVGFDGKSVGADELARSYKVFVTPTVIMVGPDGRQLADKLVGYSSPDFYGSYLDGAIDTSLERMRAMGVAANP